MDTKCYDLRPLRLADLRRHVALVEQEPFVSVSSEASTSPGVGLPGPLPPPPPPPPEVDGTPPPPFEEDFFAMPPAPCPELGKSSSC